MEESYNKIFEGNRKNDLNNGLLVDLNCTVRDNCEMANIYVFDDGAVV